jgi:hypothetical protein
MIRVGLTTCTAEIFVVAAVNQRAKDGDIENLLSDA